ncbi:MAG: DUF262 domain-containing protein, partial [Firmicutes bacterium]|nr:DUF262 domain-containing protein [Bacillota bacterium]
MPEVMFKQVNYTVGHLMDQIRLGVLGLPDIQRPFVWPATKVRDLFDSMYKGFPVGYLLFWENGADDGHRPIGVDAKQKVPRLLIVDGQQRLTSLYAVLNRVPVIREDYTPQRLQIAFYPKNETFAVSDAAIARDPEYIYDISEVYAHGALYSFIGRFVERLQQHRDVTPEEKERIAQAINRLYSLRDYPLTALELPATIDEEQVAEVFVRINSSGSALKQADFILTLMSVFWDDGRAELEDFCRKAKAQPSDDQPSPFNHYIKPNPDQLLRVSVALGFRRARLEHVYSLLRGKDLQTKQFSIEQRERQFEVLREVQKYA